MTPIFSFLWWHSNKNMGKRGLFWLLREIETPITCLLTRRPRNELCLLLRHRRELFPLSSPRLPPLPYSFRNRSMQHTPQIFLISPPAFLPAPLRSKVTVSPSSSTFFQLLCCVCTDEEERGRMWESTFFAACQGKKGVFCQCHHHLSCCNHQPTALTWFSSVTAAIKICCSSR